MTARVKMLLLFRTSRRPIHADILITSHRSESAWVHMWLFIQDWAHIGSFTMTTDSDIILQWWTLNIERNDEIDVPYAWRVTLISVGKWRSGTVCWFFHCCVTDVFVLFCSCLLFSGFWRSTMSVGILSIFRFDHEYQSQLWPCKAMTRFVGLILWPSLLFNRLWHPNA